jgi:hypothetical protein
MKNIIFSLILIIVSLLSLVLNSCSKSEVTKFFDDLDKQDKQETLKLLNDLNYFKDKKTGLCFAYISTRTYADKYVVSITNIPCETLKELKNVN